MACLPRNQEERLEWLAERLGTGRSCLKEYKEEFGLKTNQFYIDRKLALEKMADRLGDKLELWGRDLIERYEELYKKSIDRNDLKNAGKALEGLMKLKGLDTQKVELKTEGDIEINWGIGDEGSESA